MHDELVHVFGLLSESSNSIATNLRGAEVELEERIVSATNDRKVVRHVVYVVLSCRGAGELSLPT